MVASAAAPPLSPPRSSRLAPAMFAVATVAAQIAYPLTPSGAARDRLTVATVLLFFAASATHALAWRGIRFTVALIGITAGGGLLVEAIGVGTGVPFGAYRYTGTLGWSLLGVPIVIPLAWTMMAYPALVVGGHIVGLRTWRSAAVCGWALASWDLFLDPQMVDAGHWVWTGGSGPAVLGIPLLNFVGWFVVATVMMALLQQVPQRATAEARGAGWMTYSDRRDDRLPVALYLWVYVSSVLAHALFFDLPGSAGLGGVGMGIVVAALLARTR